MMKKLRFISLLLVSFCIFSLSVSAFALEARSSGQVNSYEITVTPTTGTLNIKFSVSGNGLVNKLGCEGITVYEKSGSRWVFVDSWDEDDPDMSRYNGVFCKNTIYCDSESGVEYKVVVTIFAENDDGRDTRTKTVYVTGK